MANQAPRTQTSLDLEYSYEGHTKKLSIAMSHEAAWKIIEAVVVVGDEAAFQLANLGANIAYATTGVAPPPVPTEAQIVLVTAINVIMEQFLGRQWETPEDRVLAYTYHLLQSGGGRAGATSWDTAALFASRALKREIKTDTFRKWLNRWASANSLARVQLYSRNTSETEAS